jgi:hypothetical protein
MAGRGQPREPSRARKTNGAVADGKAVWSWHPLLVLSLAEASSGPTGRATPSIRGMTVAKRNSSPGRARRKPLKPLRGECRMLSGASAVNTRVHTYYQERTRGCGCIGHPAFPAPSSIERDTKRASARGACRSRARTCVCCLKIESGEVIERTGRRSPPSSSAKADDPVIRGTSDGTERPRRTGCPAFAGHDGCREEASFACAAKNCGA